MSASETSVLIVGGGPVGLALAADLGWRGIDCILVEEGDGTIYHPRANTVNSRTMEFCRRWGIAEEVRNAGAPPDFPSTVLYLTSLQGYEVARIERPTYGGGDRGRLQPLLTSPQRSERCNQLFFDPIMRGLAGRMPSVTLRYRCRFEGFEEKDGGIIAAVRDLAGDRMETIAAHYLVACCGGRSMVPKALGAQWEGDPVVDYHLNVFLRIPDLWDRHDKGKAAFYFFLNRKGKNPRIRASSSSMATSSGVSASALGTSALRPSRPMSPASSKPLWAMTFPTRSFLPCHGRSAVSSRTSGSVGRYFSPETPSISMGHPAGLA